MPRHILPKNRLSPRWRITLNAASFALSLSVATNMIRGQSTVQTDYQNISNQQENALTKGTIQLHQAIALAVKNSPELEAQKWESEGALARIRQAQLWPNPELEYEREDFGGTGKFRGSKLAESNLSLAQSLPFGGDIQHRRNVAELDYQLADWDYHAARLELIAEVTRRFVNALADDRRLEIAQQELLLAQETERLTKSLVEAGEVSPVELARVTVPVVIAELGLKRAGRQREASYRRLSLSWGERIVKFDSLSGDLDALTSIPAPEDLVQYLADFPEVARWTTEISSRIAVRRLAKAEAIPNPTGRIGLKWDNESGDQALILGLSLPLPLFDRGQAQIQSARASEVSARSRKKAAELRIEGLLSEAYSTLANAYDEAAAIKGRVLPIAEDAYRGTQLAFKEGKLPLLDVLDAQRTLFGIQATHLQSLQTYHIGVANLESLIGRSLSELRK